MFSSQQYRAKAAEYAKLLKQTTNQDETSEFSQLECRFARLADDEEWFEKKHRNPERQQPAQDPHAPRDLDVSEKDMLRCLGAAVIMRWGTLPAKLRRELFDDASSMGDLKGL